MTALDFSTLVGEGATIRLATQEDIPAICDMRVAQSLEYWGANPEPGELAHFRSETEAHLKRTLGERVMFLFIEQDGEIASMSGVEVFDRLPTYGGVSGVQRTATVVACYTRPEFRGRGHMAAMLRAWPLVAMRVGVDAIYVETRNASMRRIAEKTGYAHASDRFRMTIEVEAD
ncbi:GNAT family N-acetyltransferase [uncultured Ellagibacter sp.]|uniref:GNAT family N-acetyltransferase n=1 Tax=uncultured Ellagibacter sp. TaxID=2137580 RepID=UPI002601A9DC|nr:GNAT family N-acetyltransferase [uncultured Ellagibacter sp.]